MYVVLTVLSIFPLLVAGRMIWIHFVEGDELRAEGDRQAKTQSILPAQRGTIVDQAGRALAVNIPRFDVAVDPTVPGFEQARNQFFQDLARITGRSASRYEQQVARRASPYFVRLTTLTDSQHQEVASWEVPGVLINKSFRRRYNYNRTAAHILGHVDTDGNGTAGLELRYNHVLKGTPGRSGLVRDRRGYRRVDADAAEIEPRDGETLVLTIDLIRQTILEQELARGVAEAGAVRGSAIAVDPYTGAILALANVPTYDPNHPAGTIRNYAITDQMEPGSTFKLVGAAAALERGVTTMTRMVDTGDGSIHIRGRKMRDTHPLGVIPFSDVITLSSNVGMAKTAMKLDRGDLYSYARTFGFGQKTWVDLPGEVDGLLKKTNRWSGTTLTSMSIGYEINVTALQLLMAYSALANGGLLRQPYVVAERRNVAGNVIWRAVDDRARRDSVRRVIDEATAQELLPAFMQVVTRGTARKAQVDGLDVAGKTGTARKTRGGYYTRKYRATFVGFFPADDPKVAMVVVMDEPRRSIYGGTVSAPVFRRVAERWVGTFPSLALRLAPRPVWPERTIGSVPNVIGTPGVVAVKRLLAAGYAVEERTEKPPLNPVTSQAPLPGTLWVPGAAVRLAVRDVPPDTSGALMPDLTGMGARSAMAWLMGHGIKARLEGHGRVAKQSVKAGSALPEEVTLHLE